jgi:hypothetical protein
MHLSDEVRFFIWAGRGRLALAMERAALRAKQASRAQLAQDRSVRSAERREEPPN